ncbi:MAG: hypothetical protein DSM107014_02455 [Gomphosphaeria aponina SAG 52.96 = DSM 107014]|uniref:Uncharacterized protein n=1 Tax=Gomphosphaeria aponina SAG 52.96 = DSM 107014 TaxID=1521640 RepID=A0A941GN09_9CHRO|nr:hypothetical protein [Gomphosphaeria aponina SAG 52.96 = DSM 107014]
MKYIFTKPTNQTKTLSPLPTRQLRYFKVSLDNSATPMGRLFAQSPDMALTQAAKLNDPHPK